MTRVSPVKFSADSLHRLAFHKLGTDTLRYDIDVKQELLGTAAEDAGRTRGLYSPTI